MASNAFRRVPVVPRPDATFALDRNRPPWRWPVLAMTDGVTPPGSEAQSPLIATYFLLDFFLPPVFFAALRFLAIESTSFLNEILHAGFILSTEILP